MNNKTAAEVIAEFRNERVNKKYLSQLAVDAIPGMSELKARKKKLLQEILSGSIKDLNKTDMEKELHEIEQRELSLLGSLQAGSKCQKCSDTGFIDGSLCQCLRDKIYREVYGAADIDSLSESFDISDRSKFSSSFKCKNGSTQRDKYIALENYARSYAEKFPINSKPNLFFTGNTGLGKTFILRSVAKYVHDKGEDVLLIDASDLFSVFHRHRLGYDIGLESLQNCSLLLIDDLGVEPSTQNVTVEYLLDLLNKRIDQKKHTVIATNLSSDNINLRYGERVYSRIRFKDVCDQLVFEGEDIRIQ
jgi:DNA replication protein DnaC